MRHEHDAAHRIAVRLLAIVSSCLREEEWRDFYREAMPVIVEGIEDYKRAKASEDARLRTRLQE